MSQHGKLLQEPDRYAMSTKDNGETFITTHEVKTPLTPPQEPLDQLETSDDPYWNAQHHVSQEVLLNGTHQAQTKDGGGNIQHNHSRHSGQKDVSNTTIPRKPDVQSHIWERSSDGVAQGLQDEHKNFVFPGNGASGNSSSIMISSTSDSKPGMEDVFQDHSPRKPKRLSADKLKELTSSPDSLPLRVLSPSISEEAFEGGLSPHKLSPKPHSATEILPPLISKLDSPLRSRKASLPGRGEDNRPRNLTVNTTHRVDFLDLNSAGNRPKAPRALSTPADMKSPVKSMGQESRKGRISSKIEHLKPNQNQTELGVPPSPMPITIPLPPLSLPTYLQLELSSHRPSQLYIHRPSSSEFPYESSRVKIERLLNFLRLPHQLESVLWFGTLACLDSWLYTFTILPLRLLKSMHILIQSWVTKMLDEVDFILKFIYTGSQRMWQRKRGRAGSTAGILSRTSSENQVPADKLVRPKTRSGKHHRRTKSTPSSLLPDDKADILKGLLIIFATLILLKLDASRMYHWVRGQAAIKLYVIYNLLEVSDRLLSALGQDVLECLFSQEALERKPDGHSKILRPFWLFMLALVYCVIHATALFYQVITLNVAVNSYSNALITLLLSVQFVEIKSTVFKKFEKENLFQLTCADIVERFHLWHMMLIIASRNVVETGGFSFGPGSFSIPVATATSYANANTTYGVPPRSASSILPRSFTIIPSMLTSITSYVPTIGHILGPFVIVLGSEMLIDWLKHAYINKFNNTKPVIYSRFLDVLAKDYYTNAFGNQNLTKRLGLPVIPLSCLMIRAGFQTYQMFMASWLPSPSTSTSTSLASIHEQYTTTRSLPTSTTGMLVRKMDEILSQLPTTLANSTIASNFTTILVLLLLFLVLLVCKLCLGMGLLAFSRARYRAMKEREQNSSHYVDGGRRVGGWGVVEVDEDKRRWIYEDDPAGMRGVRDREAKEKLKKDLEKEKGFSTEGMEKVKRYEMVAKRIW